MTYKTRQIVLKSIIRMGKVWPQWRLMTGLSTNSTTAGDENNMVDNSNNHSLQTSWAEKHLRMCNTSNLGTGGLQQMISKPCSHSCQPWTGIRGSHSHRLTKPERDDPLSLCLSYIEDIWGERYLQIYDLILRGVQVVLIKWPLSAHLCTDWI